MARCSRVWGMTDSLAATTNIAMSIAPTPGQHVLDEPLVAGHVHNADLPTAGKGEPGKAQAL